MTCREVVEFLMDYLDGQLSVAEQAIFDEHLGECCECVAYLHTYQKTIKLGKSVCHDPDLAVPEELIQAILAARAQAAANSADSSFPRPSR
jgi:predicted anti-sigma-YlaC factor YlaD